MIAENGRLAVAASAAFGEGALGLGALITAIATTAVADITGVVMAGLLATLGLFIIPTKRRQGKKKLNEKISAVHTQLIQTLYGQFDREINRSNERIREAISPYTRFVRAEREKILEIENSLMHLKVEIDRLKGKLESL